MYPVGDFLIRIKNAYMARRKEVSAPYSKGVVAIGKILEEEGYIKKLKVQSEKLKIRKDKKKNGGTQKVVVELLYKGKRPALSDVRIVSKPSMHVYISKSEIKRMGRGVGISIVSTSKGVMKGARAAKEGLGGELICQIF